MANRKEKEPTIDLCDDDFGAILNCAVRYAMGRQSYMPYLVTEFITPLLPHISDKTIWCFQRDLQDCTDWGDVMIDKPTWMRFQEAVKAEAKRRELRGAY